MSEVLEIITVFILALFVGILVGLCIKHLAQEEITNETVNGIIEVCLTAE